MSSITKSGDIYVNASSQVLRLTFRIVRRAGKGSFKIKFEAPGKTQKATMPLSANVFFATGEVEANGEVALSGLGSDDELAVDLVHMQEVNS